MDQDLKSYLDGMKTELVDGIDGLKADTAERIDSLRVDTAERIDSLRVDTVDQLERTKAELVEQMRDMQTELLRGFSAFTEGQTIRLRKVEADQSNLNAALSGRVDVVESRLLQIELRLGGLNPPAVS